MIQVTLSELSKILNGEILGYDVTFDSVTTDTRTITPGSLFVALKGKHFDAHNFSSQVKERGASAMVVNHKINVDLPQLIVEDTRLAFGKMAGWIRQQVPARVVAITGSSGKTSVKEMAASILSQCGKTLYTIGNLNNDIGVSMTLLRLTKKHKYAVIELSANHHGEIAWTASLTRPEAALINNLSAAHLEGFGSLEGVASAKGEIYTGLLKNGIAILNADNHNWVKWKTIIGSNKTWNFSLNVGSDFTADNIYEKLCSSEFVMKTPIGNIEVLLPLPGRHNIKNALAATALTMAVGAPLTAIRAGLANLKAIPGRLYPIWLAENKLLLDDSYNANVGSTTAAIQVLSKMPGYRIMVIGDIAELGEKSEEYHVHLGKMMKMIGLDHVLSIGRLSEKLCQASGIGEHFLNKKMLIIRLRTLLHQHSIITILVKGSRSAGMEEIVHGLQETGHVSLAS